VVTYSNMSRLLADLRAMGEGNALASRSPRPLYRKALNAANSIYQTNFGNPDGSINATFDLIFLSGWAPHPDQPKPLRPGSATHSLSAVLDTLKPQQKD